MPLTPTVGSELGLGWRWGDTHRRLRATDNSSITGELADARLVGCEVAIEGSSALGLYLHKKQLSPLLSGQLWLFHKCVMDLMGVAKGLLQHGYKRVLLR